MHATVRNQDGSTYPFYKADGVTLTHASTGIELKIIETEDGFKVMDVANGRDSIVIVPSSGNSIYIK